VDVLQRSSRFALQVVKSKKPKAQFNLGKSQASIGVLRLSYAKLTQELELGWIIAAKLYLLCM